MKEAERWLAYYEKFWNEQLDALERLVEREKSR